MEYPTIPFWKEIPFFRLLLPLSGGILLQYRYHFPLTACWLLFALSLICLFFFTALRSVSQFKHYWTSGILINLVLVSMGAITCFYKDIRNDLNGFIRQGSSPATYITTISEPLSEGNNSFKTVGSLDYVSDGKGCKKIRGNCILYFKKDASCKKLVYNSRIAFRNPPADIRSSGNPGAFDFRRYCAFKNIYFQVYLKPGEYVVLTAKPKTDLKTWLLRTRETVTSILRTYINGRKEAGLAEALLIGYKEDLDKDLVQSYSRTGVIHVIAISGLHVGLIYGLLSGLFNMLRRSRPMRILKAVVIITGLWLFGMLAGAGPSVMRSVLMFSFLVMGQAIGRRAAVYNSLFASAFLLLCYDPFLLWDVGFQLSYIAVLSILLFTKPIYNCLFIRNKMLDMIWKSCALCVAAQWLTTPVTVYHFHQFPNYFLVTNLVAVPLSGVIVVCEILLCSSSFFPLLAKAFGLIVYSLIRTLNVFVAHMEGMPFSVTDRLLISFGELMLVYVLFCSIAWWLLRKEAVGALVALGTAAALACSQTAAHNNASQQKKLVVYNVPHHTAIDLVKGRHYLFSGDSELIASQKLRNFHLARSRNQLRLKSPSHSSARPAGISCFYFENRRILITSEPLVTDPGSPPLKIDIAIICGDPDIGIPLLLKAVDCKLFVFDSSNSLRKVRRWKSECEAYGLTSHSVTEKGAFILNLN